MSDAVFRRYLSRLKKSKRKGSSGGGGARAASARLEDRKEKHYRRDRYLQIFREFHYGPSQTDPRSGLIRPGTPAAVLVADRNWRKLLRKMERDEKLASDVKANMIMRDLVRILSHPVHPLCALTQKFSNLFQANYYLYVHPDLPDTALMSAFGAMGLRAAHTSGAGARERSGSVSGASVSSNDAIKWRAVGASA